MYRVPTENHAVRRHSAAMGYLAGGIIGRRTITALG